MVCFACWPTYPSLPCPPAASYSQVKAAAKGLPTDLRLALRELEGLRRERDGLAAKLKGAEAQVKPLPVPWTTAALLLWHCVHLMARCAAKSNPPAAVPLAGNQAAVGAGAGAAELGTGAACHCGGNSRAAAAAQDGQGARRGPGECTLRCSS